MLVSAQLKHKNACRANFRLAVVGATGILYKVVERKNNDNTFIVFRRTWGKRLSCIDKKQVMPFPSPLLESCRW